jgi:hypothetical protein
MIAVYKLLGALWVLFTCPIAFLNVLFLILLNGSSKTLYIDSILKYLTTIQNVKCGDET